MTRTQGVSAMVAVYAEAVKHREWRLRRIREDVSKAGRITRAQYRERTRLQHQVRVLYDLRTNARSLARMFREARRAAREERAASST